MLILDSLIYFWDLWNIKSICVNCNQLLNNGIKWLNENLIFFLLGLTKMVLNLTPNHYSLELLHWVGI